MEHPGFSPDDLPAIRRELMMDALAVARSESDPASEWEAFCEAVWREAGLAYGFIERERWPQDLPPPDADRSERHSQRGSSGDI